MVKWDQKYILWKDWCSQLGDFLFYDKGLASYGKLRGNWILGLKPHHSAGGCAAGIQAGKGLASILLISLNDNILIRNRGELSLPSTIYRNR